MSYPVHGYPIIIFDDHFYKFSTQITSTLLIYARVDYFVHVGISVILKILAARPPSLLLYSDEGDCFPTGQQQFRAFALGQRPFLDTRFSDHLRELELRRKSDSIPPSIAFKVPHPHSTTNTQGW